MIESLTNRATALYRHRGPFTTAYLPSPSARSDAGELLRLRWKNLAKELRTRGATDEDIKAIDAAVDRGHVGGATLMAVAAEGHLLLEARTDQRLRRRIGTVGWLPQLAPLLSWQQSQIRQLVVDTDRLGANLTIVEHGGVVVHIDVAGDSEHIHKPQAGGWSQKRYQRRAENTWEHNAGAVAGEVALLAAEHDIDVVHVAGDVRAVALLLERLPTEVAATTTKADSSTALDDQYLQLQASSHIAGRSAAILGRFTENRARGQGAVDGVQETFDALTAGRVGTLLVHAESVDRRRAWFGDEPTPIAPTGWQARRLGVDDARSARLVEVAIRAALGTGAAVWFVPRHGPDAPTNGIGAITRFAI